MIGATRWGGCQASVTWLILQTNDDNSDDHDGSDKGENQNECFGLASITKVFVKTDKRKFVGGAEECVLKVSEQHRGNLTLVSWGHGGQVGEGGSREHDLPNLGHLVGSPHVPFIADTEVYMHNVCLLFGL